MRDVARHARLVLLAGALVVLALAVRSGRMVLDHPSGDLREWMSLAGWAAPVESGAPPVAPATPLDAGDSPAPSLVLTYAGVTYLTGGPADPVVELKVIVTNGGARHSDSTTIRLAPSFARDYTFLKGEPSAWRFRIDEWGWGVYDGPGVLPERDGTYILWFTRTGFQVDEPRVQVIGNGNLFIDDTFAIAMNRILNKEPAMQGAFERRPLGPLADRLGRAVPDAVETAPFGFALALAGTLTGLALAGIVVAARPVAERGAGAATVRRPG